MEPTVLTLDARRRANLAALADHDRYTVTREASGRIILDPAVVVTEDELKILQNQSLWDNVERSRARGGHHPRR